MNTDLKYALRGLRNNPGFACAAIVTLALGIAATNTVFTLVNGALLREMPFEGPDRIVALGVTYTDNPQRTTDWVSYPDLQDWQAAATRAFAGISGYNETTMNVSDEERPAERFLGAFVSWNSFDLLGRRPVRGRDFLPEDDRDGAPPVVIIAHSMWTRRYRADPAVIGRDIRVNGVTSRIIGVMPEGFGFPVRSEVWRPLAALDAESKIARRARFIRGVGRLRNGVSIQQAASELRGVTAMLAGKYPESNRGTEPLVEPLRSGIGPPIVALLSAMLGAVAFVLLIACANVANLLLSRAAARSHEMSVRMSIGASRWQIVRQLLVESLVLAAAAGIAGLALSIAAIRAFWSTASQTEPPYWLQFPMDWRVFTFLVLVCLGTSVLFGLVPALHTARTNIVQALADVGRGTAGSRGRRRWVGTLVIAQLALTVVLLTGAGIMIRNVLAALSTAAGVDTATLVRLRLDLPAPAYDAAEQRLGFYRRLEERLFATGLRATLSNWVPLSGGALRELLVEGQPQTEAGRVPVVTHVTIGRQYFETIGASVLRGRDLSAAGGEAERSEALVNERFAAMHFGSVDPLGRRIRLRTSNAAANDSDSSAGWLTIVGIVQNVRQRPPLDGSFDPVVYVPFAASPVASVNILVRSTAGAGLVASQIQQQVRAIDADVPVFDVRTIDDLLWYQGWGSRVFGSMFVVFGIVALTMATIGLYAVTAYSVAQRTREIGVRVALGAGAGKVWWLVASRASRQLLIGLAIGLVGALTVTRVLPREITRSDGIDPSMLVVVIGILAVAATTACVIPARRAMSVDPSRTLREG